MGAPLLGLAKSIVFFIVIKEYIYYCNSNSNSNSKSNSNSNRNNFI